MAERVPLADLAADIPNAIVMGPFGSRIKAENYTSAGVPMIRGNNLGAPPFHDTDFVFVSKEFAADLSGHFARPLDVLLAHRGNLGQVGIIPEDARYPFYITGNSLVKVTVDRNRMDPWFLYYYLASPGGQRGWLANTVQTGVPAIAAPTKSTRELRVPCPPIEEQRSIASQLRLFDDKRANLTAMNRTLGSMARALFRSWFVDFDPVRAKMEGRPTGLPPELDALFPDRLADSPLGMAPEGWTWREVGEAVEVGGGSTPSTKNDRYWGGDFHWATPKDLAPLQFPVLLDTDRKLTKEGLAETTSGLLPKGTLLLSSRAPIGYLAISEVLIAVNQGFITMKCGANPSNQFMLHWCRANMDAIIARANGTTFLEISKRNFRPMSILLPPDQVMAAFTKLVTPLHERMVSNLQQSGTLASLRDTLLPRLLSGEVRVPTEAL